MNKRFKPTTTNSLLLLKYEPGAFMASVLGTSPTQLLILDMYLVSINSERVDNSLAV